jgi:Family of unknown function (DUF6352)
MAVTSEPSVSAMPELWERCGFRQLARSADGQLHVTDDFLRLYFERPELAPIEQSCAAERALHVRLLSEPRRTVEDRELAAIADDDARENYRVMLRFRDRLLAASTLEAFYVELFRSEIAIPPAFIDEIVQVILRGLLEGVQNGLEARAAELFFRPQKVALERGAVMLADQETVQRHASHGDLGNIGRLLTELAAPLRTAELDVLSAENHLAYFERDERYDLVLDMTPGSSGAAAFGRVIERWIGHFHRVPVTVSSVREIAEGEWLWHVGLDAEATALLNGIYNGDEIEEERRRRLIGLYRAEFLEPHTLRHEVRGAPIFLGLATTPGSILRMKPQNLLMNLPLSRCT